MTDDFFDRLQPIYNVYARVVDTLMARRHVVACGIGLKVKNGELTNIPSLIISVEKKASPDDLSDDDVIPDRIDDVETDVVETGPIRPLDIDRRGVVRPVRPGLSIGHLNGTAGTAGCVVRRGSELFMLTNNHVAALMNEGRIGDPILQPGPEDGGSTLHIVGQLAEYVPIQFLASAKASQPEVSAASQSADANQRAGCGGLLAKVFSSSEAESRDNLGTPGEPIFGEGPSMVRVNRVDAALVRPVEGVNFNPRIIGLATPPTGVGAVSLGEAVFKSGRTTGITDGRVMQIDVTVDVTYDDGKARFINQVMATPFSKRGDSGSIVLNADDKAVGLIFSGSESVSVFHPIQGVLERLNVEMVTI